MNVRFFAGTRAQYNSLPSPRNRLGLYFCADTRELFWGDRLLTDGTRIVSTFSSLPDLALAADGITYFVEDTRNGYVISSDRSTWIQVIRAPEAGSAIQTISFAGIEMEEVDGVFTIDRRCAREALGFIVPEGIEDEELELVTKEYVDNQIAKIPGADLNLSEYVKQEDLGEYAKKSDIPQSELFVVDYAAPDFAAALEAYNSGKLLLLTNAPPDVNSYATMNYVRDDTITFTKFLMSRSGTYGSFNTYYLHSNNSWELAKEVKLNKVEAVADADNSINSLIIGKTTYDFDNFATTETVSQLTENIENTYVTNTTLEETKQEIANTYVTEQHITENYITVQEAANTYVTTEKVTEVVETQVNEVVTKELETKVETVIQEKVDAGELVVNADAINYDTW